MKTLVSILIPVVGVFCGIMLSIPFYVHGQQFLLSAGEPVLGLFLFGLIATCATLGAIFQRPITPEDERVILIGMSLWPMVLGPLIAMYLHG